MVITDTLSGFCIPGLDVSPPKAPRALMVALAVSAAAQLAGRVTLAG